MLRNYIEMCNTGWKLRVVQVPHVEWCFGRVVPSNFRVGNEINNSHDLNS
jgi:hypothetical protein